MTASDNDLTKTGGFESGDTRPVQDRQYHRVASADALSAAGRLTLAGAGIWVDGSTSIEFSFDGKTYSGFAGDTIASALAAHGQFVLSRSFKYHRARGALTFAGQDANTLVQIPGNPNALADLERIQEGLRVDPVNVYGSLMKDRGRVLGWFSRFLPVGFYYKAFFRPKGAWEHWSKLFRRMTGLGALDVRYQAARHDKRYRFFEVAVIGGGVAGLSAAKSAADAGCRVLLVEDQRELGGAWLYERPSSGSTMTLSDKTFRMLRADVEQHDRIEVLTSATCNGWFADNWLGVVCGDTLHKVRAQAVVLATGALEQPAIFRNNDLPGVMLSSAVQRLIRLFAVKPGQRAVVLTGNAHGYAAALDMLDAGVEVVALIDTRAVSPDASMLSHAGVSIHTGSFIKAAYGNASHTHVSGVDVGPVSDGHVSVTAHYEVDVVCVATGFMPTYQLACQAGATLDYDDEHAAFHLSDLPDQLQTAGAVNGFFNPLNALADGARAGHTAAAACGRTHYDDDSRPASGDNVLPNRSLEETTNVAWPIQAHPKGKEFVDQDEDLQIADLVDATCDGYVDMQLVKRYSTCGMGPSQGRQSALAAARIVARAKGKTVAETGITTARPPFAAESIAHSAGRSYYPERRTSMHEAHRRAGAVMMQAGAWERPAFYGDVDTKEEAIRREVLGVRHGVGVIDVSTLGGLDIRGPHAGEFINRLYTWNFTRQPVGRARYALMTDQAGVVIDDGVACRMSEHHYYVTATTSGVDSVYRAMLKWNAQWRLDVDISNVTSAYSAVNLAGPQARQVLAKLCDDIDLDADVFGYMAVREGRVAGIPARVLRVGFVGETGYEIHVPASKGEALWEAIMDAGKSCSILPFGVEAQRVMRLEKGHIIVGQDTDAMTNVMEVQMGWAVGRQKSFFVGGRTLSELEARGIKRKLVGFMLEESETALPQENQLVLDNDAMIGRVTSCAKSPTLGRTIGLAYVPYNDERPTLTIKCGGKRIKAHRVPTPFFDPDNERQK